MSLQLLLQMNTKVVVQWH